MRYLLLFLIVTVLVAIAYSSPVPETAVEAQGGKGVVPARKGPGGAVGANGKRLVKKGLKNGRRLQAGKGGNGKRKLVRRVKNGRGGPGAANAQLRRRKQA